MRAFVCIFAVLVIGIGVYADQPERAVQSVPHGVEVAGGAGDTPILMIGSAANNCSTVMDVTGGTGPLPEDGLYVFTGDTTDAGNDFEYGASACAWMGSGGQDEIWSFTVSQASYWLFSLCHPAFPAFGDTSMQITVDDGTCPGPEVACSDDACPGYVSEIEDVFLQAGNTYYIIIDAYASTTGEGAPMVGPYGVVFMMTGIACGSDEDCDDENECTLDTCLPSGACEYTFETTQGNSCDDGLACYDGDVCTDGVCGGSYICEPYQFCAEPVPPDTEGVCSDPDTCYTWLAGAAGASFFPTNPPDGLCHQDGHVGDDIELEVHGGTRELINFQHEMYGRAIYGSVLGETFYTDTGLWLVEYPTCEPWVPYPGATCENIPGTIVAGGSDPDIMLCEPNGGLPTGIDIPDNSGLTDLCEVDVWMVYQTDAPGAGVGIAGEPKYVGEPGMEDDINPATQEPYGSRMAMQLCDVGGLPIDEYQFGWFGAPTISDYEDGRVCTVPGGSCCYDAGGCDDGVLEVDCTGTWLGINTMSSPTGCLNPDGDGFMGPCDNCPDDANDGQEDCNDDGQGDACEPWDEGDDDGDGTCNGIDGCPDDPLKIAPMQCGCGNLETDTDGDGTADCNDECPQHALWQFEPPCGCDSSLNDNEDDDGDGFENCFDTCAGVDDVEFGPCDDAIPTVSEWGLVIMALLLLAAGKVYFGRRPEMG